MRRRLHSLPRYEVRSSPLRFTAFAQAVGAKALHVTSVEYVYHHIPSSTFRHVSVLISLSLLSLPMSSVAALLRVFGRASNTVSVKFVNCYWHEEHVAQHLHQIDHHVHRSTFDSCVKL